MIHPPPLKTEIPALTGLRGLAVALTVLAHLANEDLAPSAFGHGFGQFGVMLFFVLSAYLMTRLYLGTPFATDTARSYLRARIGRVVPLYLLIVALSVLATAFGLNWRYDISGLPQIVSHVGFVMARRELWAIPVEVQFYGVFLALWWVCSGHRPLWLWLLAVLTVSAGLVALQFQLAGRAFGLPYHLSYFVLGMVLGLTESITSRIAHLRPLAGWALSLIVLLSFLPMLPLYRGSPLPLWLDPRITVLIALSFIAARHRIGAFALLTGAPFCYLGRISYGLYLIHPVVLHALPETLAPAPRVTLTIGISIGLAHLSWHWFERPLARHIRRLGHAAPERSRVRPSGATP